MNTKGGDAKTIWNREFPIPVHGTGFWQIGPFRIWVQRSPNELKVASVQGTDALERTLLAEVRNYRSEPPEGTKVQRFGFQHTPEAVTLNPTLADRPVVVSPEEPLHLPPEEQIVLFISTPVWIELTVGSPPLALVDEPTHRPSDTWFGSSSMKGELCYATRTAARMNLENIPSRPHRVISVVEIRNRAQTMLTVEKLKIPLIHQSVYMTKRGDLWTESVTLDHREEGALASVELGKGPPKNAADARMVRGPRTPMEAGLLTWAFGGLVR